MSSAPDFTCWIRSPSLPSCSAGNTLIVTSPLVRLVTLSANSWNRSVAISPLLLAWPKRSVVAADAALGTTASAANTGRGERLQRAVFWSLNVVHGVSLMRHVKLRSRRAAQPEAATQRSAGHPASRAIEDVKRSAVGGDPVPVVVDAEPRAGRAPAPCRRRRRSRAGRCSRSGRPAASRWGSRARPARPRRNCCCAWPPSGGDAPGRWRGSRSRGPSASARCAIFSDPVMPMSYSGSTRRKSVPPASTKSALGSTPRTCSVCSSGVLIMLRRRWCAKAETPPSRNGSSYQKKPASSQARPTYSASAKVRSSHAGSSISVIRSPTALATCRTFSRFFARVAVVPAVDLERPVAQVVAGLGEVGVGLLRGRGRRPVAVVGAGIGGQALAVAAEQLRDRRIEVAPGPVPQGDVDRAMAHVVELADVALQVLVDRDALASRPCR